MEYTLMDIFFFQTDNQDFLRTYHFLLWIYHVLFYWYFFKKNYCVDNQKKIPDSTKSRDCEEDLQILPAMATPITNDLVTVRPQIIFFQHNYFDELGSTPTYEANVIYPVLSFPDLSITVSTFHIFDAPLLHQDQHLQEFLDGECHHNFINQNLSFLQPSMVYETTASDDNQSTASGSTDASITTVIENNSTQEVDNNPLFDSVTVLSDEPVDTDYSHIPIQPVEPAPIQPVEPVIGLTTEEQRCRKEDPNLTINELLGLSACEGHVNMPLQTLVGQYMNQPSHFLPLVQEARKLAQKIKQEEEASQWAGILTEQLLNDSFTEQLNSIQSLQQIAPLQAVKEHLPEDIITILERLGKVGNTPFNKLYFLVENCVDCYYMSVIKTFFEIIKHSATDCQVVLVNTARALKYLEDSGQRQAQLFKVLEKYHLLPDNFENLQSQFSRSKHLLRTLNTCSKP